MSIQTQDAQEPWLAEAATVYQLHQVGWRKGEPVMANRQWLQVTGATKEENEALAQHIAALLNEEE